MSDGLGLLSGSACPHLTSDAQRRPRYVAEIESGNLAGGYGMDDGAAVHFVGTALERVVTEVPGRSASRFERADDGTVSETRLEAVSLGILDVMCHEYD